MKKMTSPLIYPAVALSVASLAWTTWSLVDLLGTGLIGITVAAGADVIWGSVILAEARRLRVAGKAWVVPLVGWAALLAVAGLLVWHGLDKDVLAMAAAGPLLPLGAKAVWALALADMRDPAALTDDELHQLARMERGMAFEEAKHRIEMRRREMGAELQMGEVSMDFDIELMRQDKARELNRRRPLELPASQAGTEPGATVERVPVPPPSGQPVPEAVPARPELTAVPEPESTPVPVRQARLSTAKRQTKPGTAKKASTASFDDHVRTATGWLTAEPDLSGTAIGTRLGTGDSYGRRVRRAALSTTQPGPAPRPGTDTVGKGGEGYN
ncbi:hypothetical protein NLX86_18905 [Streptomyces sp. A3M-1-3]|uniref:hypothetical protein n=1 Tax=Streptomyces sp. A3M-1-3 TaxID=2962044 RepID=UPI0020B6B3A2|nr:hypothetical protein [Streptomyces sp. A3M-1-3]MCP3820088.1 hypothetical protein [Streptomyces sp. A3M-1-3]